MTACQTIRGTRGPGWWPLAGSLYWRVTRTGGGDEEDRSLYQTIQTGRDKGRAYIGRPERRVDRRVTWIRVIARPHGVLSRERVSGRRSAQAEDRADLSRRAGRAGHRSDPDDGAYGRRGGREDLPVDDRRRDPNSHGRSRRRRALVDIGPHRRHSRTGLCARPAGYTRSRSARGDGDQGDRPGDRDDRTVHGQ